MTFKADFEPLGRRVDCQPGATLLETARDSGILLNATCGGEGLCGRCIVRLMAGDVSPPTGVELSELGTERIVQGWRLACQAVVQGDVRVHIPPESLATAQRIQVEGMEIPHVLSPAVQAVQVVIEPPSLADLRADTNRLRDALGSSGLRFPLPVLRSLAADLQENNFHPSVYLCTDRVVAVRPSNSQPLGLAVDLGTTKLAGYLVDLSTGNTLASRGAMNPQIAFGEDVMARINHAITAPNGAGQLSAVAIQAISDLAQGLCQQSGRSMKDIADAVIVGNTAMHHLLLGLPVRQLGLAPYVPAESAPLDIPATDLGFAFSPGASIHLLPNIAGFVGADHVAMLLGSGMLARQGVVLGMDIGTNTEISLIAGTRHLACSTASGPAFEGAHIRHGMRAAAGAVEKVLIRDGKVKLQTIEGLPPVGLCGSGILDLVAQLRCAGLLNSRGSFVKSSADPRLRQGSQGGEYVLVSAVENGGREITFDRRDVNEIQLAKGAMRAGIQILLRKAGLVEADIDAVIIAGAFGTYLDVQSGIDIGMFPRLDKQRFSQVGNAAGSGARLALLSMECRREAVEVARRVEYIELTVEKEFASIFARSLLLD